MPSKDEISIYSMGSTISDGKSDSNITTDNTLIGDDSPTKGDIVFVVYYYGILFIISLINIIGNSMVIKVFASHKSLRVPGNYFILSLAISDFVFGIIYPIYNVLHVEETEVEDVLGGWQICTIVITLTLGLLSVSSFNLVGITVVRFISIKNPLTFQTKVTHIKAIIAAVSVWVVMFALTMAVFFRPDNEEFGGTCRYELFLNVYYLTFTSILSFFVPIGIMTPLYIYMALQAWKQARQIADIEKVKTHQFGNKRDIIFKREMKMFRMTALLLGYFTFAWMPYIIYEIVFFTCDCDIDRYVRATVRLLLHSNSAVNVWIYTARLKEVRHMLKQDCLNLPCYKVVRRCQKQKTPSSSKNNINTIGEYNETIGSRSQNKSSNNTKYNDQKTTKLSSIVFPEEE